MKSEDLIKRYPYYVIPDIEALSAVRDPQLIRFHRRRIAACIGDPDALRAVLGDASEDFQDFYGTSDLPTLSTADTIDSFLEKFGSREKPKVPETPPVVDFVVPVDPSAIDYAAMLEKERPDEGLADVPEEATLGA
ncbi:MAG: hypothetical protein K2M16_01810, partial [Muribaculaceae bacterium]|nr:hypothetical protein [Muribaculaceae bacterium]